MTKAEALKLLASGETLTEEQREAIATVLSRSSDPDDEDDWQSSNCWDESSC